VYFAEVHPDHQSAFAIERFVEMGKDPARMAQTVYGKSRLLQPEALRQALAAGPDAFVELVRGDLAYQLARSIADINETKVLEPYNRIRDELKLLQQQYMQAQMEVFPERRFYP
ncbi:S46 family peptidase, partial [Arthrospira platensis SPKY1]|nr:S46 family peptidase [Arthrospira platensis SPKY1]